MPGAQHHLLDGRQRLYGERSMLLRSLRDGRNLSGIVVLRTAGRRVRHGLRLLYRHVQRGCRQVGRHLRDLSAVRPCQLRPCRRTALRWRRSERECARLRRRSARLRRTVLQSCLRAVGSHGRSRLSTGERLPRRRRPLHQRRGLLRLRGFARRVLRSSRHLCDDPAIDRGRVSQSDGMQTRRRRVQARDVLVQLVVRLLFGKLRESRHLPPRQRGRAAMLACHMRQVRGSLRVECGLLRRCSLRSQSDGRRHAGFHLRRRAVRERLRRMHNHRRLLPRFRVLGRPWSHAWHVRTLLGRRRRCEQRLARQRSHRGIEQRVAERVTRGMCAIRSALQYGRGLLQWACLHDRALRRHLRPPVTERPLRGIAPSGK
jgi:hypothetical protein